MVAPPVVVTTAPAALTVIDTRRRFAAGAAVSSGANTATTDATGRATLAMATGSEHVVAVAKASPGTERDPIRTRRGPQRAERAGQVRVRVAIGHVGRTFLLAQHPNG